MIHHTIEHKIRHSLIFDPCLYDSLNFGTLARSLHIQFVTVNKTPLSNNCHKNGGSVGPKNTLKLDLLVKSMAPHKGMFLVSKYSSIRNNVRTITYLTGSRLLAFEFWQPCIKFSTTTIATISYKKRSSRVFGQPRWQRSAINKWALDWPPKFKC